MKYRLNGDTLILTGELAEIKLTCSQVQELAEFYYTEVFYREDVEHDIEQRIEDGYLPEGAKSNKEYINAVLNVYAHNRIDNDGTDYCMSWQEALHDAFNEIRYEDYI